MSGRSHPRCAFDSRAQTFCHPRSSEPSRRTATFKARSLWSALSGQVQGGRVTEGGGKDWMEEVGWCVGGQRTAVTVSIHQGAQGWHGSRQERRNTRRRRRRRRGQGAECGPSLVTPQPSSTLVCCPTPHSTSSPLHLFSAQMCDPAAAGFLQHVLIQRAMPVLHHYIFNYKSWDYFPKLITNRWVKNYGKYLNKCQNYVLVTRPPGTF